MSDKTLLEMAREYSEQKRWQLSFGGIGVDGTLIIFPATGGKIVIKKWLLSEYSKDFNGCMFVADPDNQVMYCGVKTLEEAKEMLKNFPEKI